MSHRSASQHHGLDARLVSVCAVLLCSALEASCSVHRLELIGSAVSYYTADKDWQDPSPVFEFQPLLTTGGLTAVQIPQGTSIKFFSTIDAVIPPVSFSIDAPAQNSADPAVADFVRIASKQDELHQLARYDEVSGPNADVYLVTLNSYSPYVMYALHFRNGGANGTSSEVHECDPVLGAGGFAMECGVWNGLAITPSVTFRPYMKGKDVFIELVLDSSLDPDRYLWPYLSVALHRLMRLQQMQREADTIKQTNDDRTSDARLTTGFLFFFIAVGMFVWSILFGLLLAWALPIIPVPEALSRRFRSFAKPNGKVKFNTIVMSVAAVFINFTVSAAAGFTGWFLLGFLYMIGGTTIGIVFCCKKCCCNSEGQVAPGQDDNEQCNQTEMQQKTDTDQAAAIRTQAVAVGSQQAVGEDAEEGAVDQYPSTVFERPLPRWAHLSADMTFGRTQVRLLIIYFIMLILIVVIMLIIVYTWEIAHYKVYDRRAQVSVTEDIPPLTAKAVQILYAWNGLASNLKLDLYTKWLTQWCGRKYRESLSDSEKEVEIKEKFIDEYAIDMREYDPSYYKMYPSVNTWFIRGLAVGSRPLAGTRLQIGTRRGVALPPAHSNLVVSPADCRILIFPTLEHSRVWVKGSRFNYGELMGGDRRRHWGTYFAGGAMVIARLAPQDYHRFNSPISGEIVDYYELDGTYWSVNADAAKSKNYAFYNLRKVLVIKYTDPFGEEKYMSYVAIGATCVGSVIFTKATGPIQAGEELGFMQFGGSTVVMLFQQGQLVPDEDIYINSLRPVESLIKVNERLGKLVS